jgi:hypothetical protein
MRPTIVVVLVAVGSASAEAQAETTIGFDPFVIHRPVRDAQQLGDINSAFDFVVTRGPTRGLYVGGGAGFVHVGVVAGVRWITGARSGMLLAAEARLSEEILNGPAVYGRFVAGWVFAGGFMISPAIEAGRCWVVSDSSPMHRVAVDLIGGTLELGYRW